MNLFLLDKLKSLNAKFRGLHYEVIDLIDDGSEDIVEAEQVILDKYDDDISTLTVHLESLSTASVSTTGIVDTHKPLATRHSRLQTASKGISGIIHSTSVEKPVLMQYQEEVSDYKKDLATLYDDLVLHDVDEDEELSA